MVLESNAAGVRIGLQPERNGNGSLDARRVTGQIDADGVRWTRKGKPGAFLSPGDVIYAEPIEKRPGFYRLRQIPAISGAMVADKTRSLIETGAHQVLTADCGCLMNINGSLEKQKQSLRGQHLASFLWQRTGGEQ